MLSPTVSRPVTRTLSPFPTQLIFNMRIRSVVALGLVVGNVQLTLALQPAAGGNKIAEFFANHAYLGNASHTKNDTIAVAGVPPPVPPRPAPRPPFGESLALGPSASDAVWDKAVCKGANFVRAMRGTDAEAGNLFSPLARLLPQSSRIQVWYLVPDLRMSILTHSS